MQEETRIQRKLLPLRKEKKKWNKHKSDDKKEKKNYANAMVKEEEADMVLMAQQTNKKQSTFTKNTWIVDTGATSNMMWSDKHITKVIKIDEKLKINAGKWLKSMKKGDYNCTIIK